MLDTVESELLTFKEFLRKDVNSAYKELEGIEKESNRTHLQKLVYSDIVNRFDSLIDKLLLIYAPKIEDLRNLIIKGPDDKNELPLSRSELYEALLDSNPAELIKKKIVEGAEQRILRKRHSEKLKILLFNCFDWNDQELKTPCVDSDGSIKNTNNRKGRKIPAQVIGFADWLYSRRNAFVHGSRNKIDEGDLKYMKKHFNVEVSPLISLRISSIKSVSRFYSEICEMMSKKLTK